MSDAFGKITGFMLAAVLLFIIPIIFYANRQQNLSQLYAINKSVQLVEEVKNTGVMTDDMYRLFETNISLLGGKYEIDILRSHTVYNQDVDGNYIKAEDVYYTPQLMEEMDELGKVIFCVGDYVYLQVKRVEKGVLEAIGGCFLGEGIPKEEMITFYGGYVKNESY